LLPEHRNYEKGSNTAEFDGGDRRWFAPEVALVRRHMGDMDHLFVPYRSAQWRLHFWTNAPARVHQRRRPIVYRSEAKSVPLPHIQTPEIGLTDASRVIQHGLEHGCDLARRAGNDTQHLRRRGLLLQCLGKVPPRLGELTGARFELLFQLDQC